MALSFAAGRQAPVANTSHSLLQRKCSASHRIPMWQDSACAFTRGVTQAYTCREVSAVRTKVRYSRSKSGSSTLTNKDKDKHSGKFTGHVQLDGLDITPDTKFDSVRSQLEKAGFEVTEDQNIISARKGDITIFTVETTNKIERVEAWCS